MPNYISRERLKRKALDRWENEGGLISAENDQINNSNSQSTSRTTSNYFSSGEPRRSSGGFSKLTRFAADGAH